MFHAVANKKAVPFLPEAPINHNDETTQSSSQFLSFVCKPELAQGNDNTDRDVMDAQIHLRWAKRQHAKPHIRYVNNKNNKNDKNDKNDNNNNNNNNNNNSNNNKTNNHLCKPSGEVVVAVAASRDSKAKTDTTQTLISLFKGLQQNKCPSQLNLESFGDNNNHTCWLPKDCFVEIARLPQLNSLTIINCPHWRRLIVKALSQRKAPLRSLHLASCALSKTDFKLLVGQLTGNPFLRNSLEDLSICESFATTDVAWESNDVLASLQRLPSLRKLTLVQSGLNQKTMEAIVPLLRKDSPLRHLTMHGYAWDNHTSQMLGGALEHSRLESLSLGFVDRSFAVADLVQVLKTHNCCLNDVELASIELEPMKGVDELSYWCKLNKWGRATTRRVDLPKSCFVALMTKQRFDVELSYGLLREVPHMCRLY